MKAAKNGTAQPSLYARLSSRRVDLIGQELFLVDGDSLLLYLCSDDYLDFNHGLQLLHLVYKVEAFLQQLLDRRANFHLVWYQSNANLCVPATRKGAKGKHKYAFAREVVVRHLDHFLHQARAGVQVHKFDSPDSKAALDFYASSGAYFVMCHDGAGIEEAHEKDDNDSAQEIQEQRLALREMISFFVLNKMSVALINEISFRDTKVMTQVLESISFTPTAARAQVKLRAAVKTEGAHNGEQSTSGPEDDSMISHLKKLAEDNALGFKIGQRAFLLCTACKSLAKQSDDLRQFVSATLLHLVLMQVVNIAHRRLPAGSELAEEATEAFVAKLLSELSERLRNTSDAVSQLNMDVADLFDGRLFNYVLKQHATIAISPAAHAAYLALCELAGVKALEILVVEEAQLEDNQSNNPGVDDQVLPFTHEAFDSHLSGIQLSISRKDVQETPATNKIFQDLTHWHSAQRPLNKKAAQPALDGRALRRNQFYLAEMAAYAASLTNSIGRSLDPEIIVVDASKKPDAGRQKALEVRSKPGKDVQPKKSKMTPQQSQKLAKLEAEASKRDAKQKQADAQLFQAWKQTVSTLDSIKDGQKRYLAAQSYLSGLTREKRNLIQAEVSIYSVCSLLADLDSKSPSRMSVIALAVHVLQEVASNPELTQPEAAAASALAKYINAPIALKAANNEKRSLAFEVKLSSNVSAIQQDWREFQLTHAGPYMDRNIDAEEDERVPFKPDAWQRKVLDSLDEDKSVFVVAPTSAGKTFISFYAMRKILASSDDSVLVYLAPTKALVNQIAAEIQARFKKQYRHAGNSVWAIHTRDHRINNPSGCQILVTVPHVLQIMLLAPENAKTWAPRVKRIIFDEIHCIGQADDGLVWEQLLLLAPCPIIALSATVGNSEEFSSWMGSTQEALGNELVKIEHKHRYSDLRKFIFRAPKRWAFEGLPTPESIVHVGIEDPEYFSFVHPVASLLNRSRGMPEDLSLEARDCLTLYQAMAKTQTKQHPIGNDLGPDSLPAVVAKVDVLKWEARLKAVLGQWMADSTSPFDSVIQELSRTSENNTRPKNLVAAPGKVASQASTWADVEELPEADRPDALKETALPLLVSLERQGALPAILFNYDRSACEDICKYVLEQLQSTEVKWKAKSSAWIKKMARFEEWKTKRDAAAKKLAKIGKKGKSDLEPGMSKTDRAMLEGAEEIGEFESFDPEAPQDAFSFAEKRKLQAEELKVYTDKLHRRHVEQWLIDALERGLGVHHAGMNRLYRQTVEVLFRRGFLRVIIATGTLALGINMPCKTVVFVGDSVFLTALNYRQASGRAGRRGFDLLGNVVFHGLSNDKVYRLLSSRLPDLNGHFPVTTTLVLRLFSLLSNSGNAPYARQAVKALLSQPRVYLGAIAFKQQVLHHLRFSIDYLRRQNLLSAQGIPINFAGTIQHLYYTENSGFAFHVLLKSGYFHVMAQAFKKNPDECKLNLMLVLSHLFGRQVCKISDWEYAKKDLKMSSSTVFLPELPKDAKQILEDHNAYTRKIFTTYVKTFVAQHLSGAEQSLPLSGLAFEGSKNPPIADLAPASVRSAFVALSGQGDDFASVTDLCSTVRSGVFLEQAAVPHLDIYPDAEGRQLNAYLYDYYRNTDMRAILEDNGIGRGSIWFLLNDFSLVLATIVASLTNYIRASPMSELDMLDIQGGGDAADINKDDETAGADSPEEAREKVAQAKNALTEKAKPKKKKVADSWDDEEVSSEEDDDDETVADTPADSLSETATVFSTPLDDETDLRGVLNMFQALQVEFNVKFREMWA